MSMENGSQRFDYQIFASRVKKRDFLNLEFRQVRSF